MKLSAREAQRFLAAPGADRPGVLLYGTDTARVAMRRKELVTTLIGPEGEAEMRLTRLSGGEVRSDPAAVRDATKAQGFFPGRRAVLVEEPADGQTGALEAALADWRAGDAQIVVTARALAPGSALRKLFEKHATALAIGIYDDPPDRAEIDRLLTAAGLPERDREAAGELAALAEAEGPAAFRQTVEKLALYKLGEAGPVTGADVAAIAPVTTDAATDTLCHAVAEKRPGEIGPLLARLSAQGVAPVGLCIAATRHFRVLHLAASDPGGAAKGIAKARPPVHFRNRDRMIRQARSWGMRGAEKALAQLVETDLALRSTAAAPARAVIERTLLRLAMQGGR